MAAPNNPAPPFLLTIFFGKANQGWSEGYYIQFPDYNAAATGALALINLRKPMFTPDVSIPYFRVSDPSVRGDSFVKTIIPAAVGTGSDDWTMYEASTALVMRSQAANGKYAIRPLHAIPTVVVDEATELYAAGNSAAWDTAFGAYVTWLKANSIFYHKNVAGVYEAQTIVDVALTRLSHRDAGRPFGLSRGRRAATATP